MRYTRLFIGLVLVNYFYQWQLADVADYSLAAERSYFQGVAILAMAIGDSALYALKNRIKETSQGY